MPEKIITTNFEQLSSKISNLYNLIAQSFIWPFLKAFFWFSAQWASTDLLQNKIPESFRENHPFFYFEATQNKVSIPIKYKKKPLRSKKAFQRTKQRKTNKIYNVRAINFTNYRIKSKAIASTMKTADSTRSFSDAATKPTKYSKQTKVLQFKFSWIFTHTEKSTAGIQTPDMRVQRQTRYL